jgi:hypothetical protein
MVHKIVTAKIGILFEKTILRRFFMDIGLSPGAIFVKGRRTNGFSGSPAKPGNEGQDL